MKSCIAKTAVLALAISVLSLLGCETVVTDVNAELSAIYPQEDLGIPVKLNENYIEVAYNPTTDSEDDVSTDIKSEEEEKTVGKTETVSNTENEDDIDENIPSDSETDTGNDKEDIKETDGEDLDSVVSDPKKADDEEAQSDDEENSDTESDEENAEEDLNASMAEENFDAEFYASTYPDVVAVFGNSPEALYKHYTDYGKAEGRSCNAEEFALLNESSN